MQHRLFKEIQKIECHEKLPNEKTPVDSGPALGAHGVSDPDAAESEYQ